MDQSVRNKSSPTVGKILNPPIVVALGGPGWQATKLALEIKEAPEKISEAAGGQWRTAAGIHVFAVGHCGPLGIANQSLDKQLEDWSRIADALRQLTQTSTHGTYTG